MDFSDETSLPESRIIEEMPLQGGAVAPRDLENGFENLDTKLEGEFQEAIAKAGGVGALVMSAVFNDAALPPGFMQRYAELVTWKNRDAGDWSIGNGAGPVDQKTKKEQAEEAEERAMDDARGWADQAADRRTISQRDLDDMQWQGDQNTVWTFGGKQGSRKSWYDAAKAVRQQLPQLAEENDWDDDTLAEQERIMSQYMKALKDNDEQKAAQYYRQMKPETQHAVELQQQKGLASEVGMSTEAVRATNISESTSSSTDAWLRIREQAAEDGAAIPHVTPTSPSASGSGNNPDLSLTDHHRAAVAATTPPILQQHQWSLPPSASLMRVARRLSGRRAYQLKFLYKADGYLSASAVRDGSMDAVCVGLFANTVKLFVGSTFAMFIIVVIPPFADVTVVAPAVLNGVEAGASPIVTITNAPRLSVPSVPRIRSVAPSNTRSCNRLS